MPVKPCLGPHRVRCSKTADEALTFVTVGSLPCSRRAGPRAASCDKRRRGLPIPDHADSTHPGAHLKLRSGDSTTDDPALAAEMG